MDATTILQGITLAVVGWTLKKVIDQGERQARHDENLRDLRRQLKGLPCSECDLES